MSNERIRRQIIHSQKRFKQRYNNIITEKQIGELIKDVQNGYCQPIAKVSNTVSVFKSGEWIFVYDRKRKNVMTFLTEDMIDGYLQKERNRQKRSVIGKSIKIKNEDIDNIYNDMLGHISN